MNSAKILVVIDQLAFGGAGRVCSILVDGLVERGSDVTVCTSTRYHPINYKLSEKVQIKEWYDPEPVRHTLMGKFLNMYNRHKYYRRALRDVQPDMIIAFTHYIFFYVRLWTYGYDTPIIASDHTSMGRDLGHFSNFIRHKYYAKADIVTILTNKDSLLLGDKLPNKVIVYNPVTFDGLVQPTERRRNIICVGRKDFWSVKGFDRMIQIWSMLASEYPEWVLEIVGPGQKDSEDKLMMIVDKYRLHGRVRFVGEQSDMQTVYTNASIFALPSRVEGFPMVLLEAMSQGCACVSFSMQGAIKEIINDGLDGSIVADDDISGFAEKLKELIEDDVRRESYSTNAMKNVQRFSKNRFIDRWEELIKRLTLDQ